jgi:hypothetical protein
VQITHASGPESDAMLLTDVHMYDSMVQMDVSAARTIVLNSFYRADYERLFCWQLQVLSSFESGASQYSALGRLNNPRVCVLWFDVSVWTVCRQNSKSHFHSASLA